MDTGSFIICGIASLKRAKPGVWKKFIRKEIVHSRHHKNKRKGRLISAFVVLAVKPF